MAETALELDDFGLEPKLISRDDGPPELGFVDLGEEDELGLGIGDRMEEKDPAGLGDGLDDEDAGHDLKLREMALEEGFIVGDVLDGDDGPPRLDVQDPVDEKKGIAVGQKLKDLLNIHRPDAALAACSLGGRRRLGRVVAPDDLVGDADGGTEINGPALGQVQDDVEVLLPGRSPR